MKIFPSGFSWNFFSRNTLFFFVFDEDGCFDPNLICDKIMYQSINKSTYNTNRWIKDIYRWILMDNWKLTFYLEKKSQFVQGITTTV